MSGLLKAFFLFFFFYPDLNTNSMTVARSYQDVLVKGVPFVLLERFQGAYHKVSIGYKPV